MDKSECYKVLFVAIEVNNPNWSSFFKTQCQKKRKKKPTLTKIKCRNSAKTLVTQYLGKFGYT